jgi:transcriptional regulator with PAS, ATPase and Fis domain
MNKSIQTIPVAATATLTRYDWPGNVRELLLSEATTLYAQLARSAVAQRREREARLMTV